MRTRLKHVVDSLLSKDLMELLTGEDAYVQPTSESSRARRRPKRCWVIAGANCHRLVVSHTRRTFHLSRRKNGKNAAKTEDYGMNTCTKTCEAHWFGARST